MTAEEFYKDNIGIYDSPIEMMVAFARLHVADALREASEEFRIDYMQTAILNAYPLDKIK